MLPSVTETDREVIDRDPRLERRRAARARNRVVFSVAYVAVGVIALALAVMAPPSRSIVLFGVAGLGIVGGVVYYLAAGYDLARSIESVMVGGDGLQLRRRNGDVLTVRWTDPDLDLTVWERQYQGLNAPVCTLLCRVKGRTSRVPVTNEGAAFVGQQAKEHGLPVDVTPDRFGRETRIRANARVGP